MSEATKTQAQFGAQREQVIRLLREHKADLAAKYGVTQLGVFGSIARDEATEHSDVDIVVHMPPDLFLMVHMKDELEQLLHGSVDLIRYQRHLNTLLKRRIDNEAVYV
jgi:predicted nucleotidyltransferase